MKKSSPESVLISTMINTGNPALAASVGVTLDHLVGYQDEFRWIQDYWETYGEMPSEERMSVRFPGFPLSPDETDPRWPAREILEQYGSRQALSAIVRATDLLDTNQVQEAIDVLHSVTYASHNREPQSLLVDPGYLDDYLKPSEQRIELPYHTLQMLTNGIGPGELWYWAARPMQGKSSYLVDIATEAAWRGARVMMISLEMTKRQCQVRFHAAMGRRLEWGNRINAVKMLRREFSVDEYRKLLGDIGDAVIGTLDIHDTSDGFASPSTVLRYVSEYDLVLVDYVGLMRLDTGARSIDDWRTAATVSNALKEAALAKNGRILAAAQVNRDGDTAGWRPPKLKNLAQSDALGQDGDVVVTMKRYNPSAEVLLLDKNRHGESNRLFFTRYLPNTGDFTEITRNEADKMDFDTSEDY